MVCIDFCSNCDDKIDLDNEILNYDKENNLLCDSCYSKEGLK